MTSMETEFILDESLLPSEYVIIEALNHNNCTITEIEKYLENVSIFPIELSTSRIYKILQDLHNRNILSIDTMLEDGRMRKYILNFNIIINVKNL